MQTDETQLSNSYEIFTKTQKLFLTLCFSAFDEKYFKED